MLDLHRFARQEHRQLSEDIVNWAEPIPGLSDSYDSGDLYGCLMSYGFALCDYATDNGIPVPAALEFQQALGGSDTESYDFQTIQAANPDPGTVEIMLTALHDLIEKVHAADLAY